MFGYGATWLSTGASVITRIGSPVAFSPFGVGVPLVDCPVAEAPPDEPDEPDEPDGAVVAAALGVGVVAAPPAVATGAVPFAAAVVAAAAAAVVADVESSSSPHAAASSSPPTAT